MKAQTRRRLDDLVETYARTTSVMEHGAAKAIKEEGRAYGGIIRAAKGQLQEFITDELVQIAWNIELNKDPKRLTINSEKIPIPIKLEYVEKIRDASIRDYILSNMKRYYYGLSVDKHIFIDKNFVIGIECKAYAEPAIFKRILADVQLLKAVYPNLICYLFQLENILGGDYSSEVKSPKVSAPALTLMSHFPDVDLNIVTLFPLRNKVDEHHFPKELTVEKLERALMILVSLFKGQGNSKVNRNN